MSTSKSAYDSLLKILSYRMHLQGTITVGNKIEDLLSRIVALEESFDSRPGDVAEQRRRDEVRSYVIIAPLDLVLSSFQQLRTYWRTTGVSG